MGGGVCCCSLGLSVCVLVLCLLHLRVLFSCLKGCVVLFCGSYVCLFPCFRFVVYLWCVFCSCFFLFLLLDFVFVCFCLCVCYRLCFVCVVFLLLFMCVSVCLFCVCLFVVVVFSCLLFYDCCCS